MLQGNFGTNHGAAANLVLLERLLDLLEHGKVADVDTNALAGRSERAQGVGNVDIDLTGVCLTGDDEGGAETSLFGDELVQSLNLVVVAVENLEERGLSTGSTLDTTEAQVVTGSLEVSQVHEQVLNPQACSLSDSHELGGLSVGETQARQVLVLLGEGRELVDHNGQLGDENVQTVTEEDEVGVVSAVARSSTPVDDSGSCWCDLSVGVNVGHDIVSSALLLLGGNLEFVVLDGDVGLHLLETLIGNGETEF